MFDVPDIILVRPLLQRQHPEGKGKYLKYVMLPKSSC